MLIKRRLFRFVVLLLFLFSVWGEAQANLSLTTGLPTVNPYRPVLVAVSNDEAGQEALRAADIVYEAPFGDGGYTQFLALFQDHHPESVGHIRALRTLWIELREMWGCPIVHVGYLDDSSNGSGLRMATHAYNKNKDLYFDGFSDDHHGLFSRQQSHMDVMANLQHLVRNAWPLNDPRLPNLTFSSNLLCLGDEAVTIRIQYAQDENTVHYQYRPELHQYERITASGAWLVANVVVLYVEDLSEEDSGVMDTFIDGIHTRGRWQRVGDGWLSYRTEEGNDMIWLPGQTIVQMVPGEVVVDYY